jgi:hypothetical protein
MVTTYLDLVSTICGSWLLTRLHNYTITRSNIWTVQKPWADARGGDTRWAATVGQHSAGAVGVERSWGARTVKDFAQRPWARPSRVASGQFQMDLGRTVPMDRAR